MEENNKIHLINLSEYTPPSIHEDTDNDVVWFGDRDGYYDYVLDCYEYSPTNAAVLNTYSDQVYGKGLDATNKKDLEGWIEVVKLFKPECLRNVARDISIFDSFALELILNNAKNKIVEVNHIPYNQLRDEKCDKNGDVNNYYRCWDWTKLHEEGIEVKEGIEKGKILKRPNWFTRGEKAREGKYYAVYRPYSPGRFYYNPVSYQGGIQYAELEKELANYYITLVSRGFMPRLAVNFNNGNTDKDSQRNIVNKMRQKFEGSQADPYLISFNESKEHAVTFDSLPLNDAPQQYDNLNKQAQDMILRSHRVSSPLLLGIRGEGQGLGSNADEIKNAYQVQDNTVIRPKQERILDALDGILAFNKLSFDLYFKPVTPIEFTDTEELTDTAEIQKETGQELSDERPFLKDDLANDIISKLEGLGESEEDLLNDFELVDSEIVDDEPEDFNAEEFLNNRTDLEIQVSLESYNDYPEAVKNNAKRGIDLNEKAGNKCATQVGKVRAQQLADGENISVETIERMYSYLSRAEEYYDEGDTEACGTISYLLWGGKAALRWAESKLKELDRLDLAAQEESAQDSERYKVRYVYTKGTRRQPKGESRPLCRALMAAQRVYRKEDIVAMSSQGGAEAQGSPYSVWMYKGGANCYHRWERRVYRKKLTKEGEVWGGGALNGTKKISVNDAIRQGFSMPPNPQSVAKAPITTPTKGYKS